jgi:flavoprotein
LITIKAEDEEEHDTIVKVKFYEFGQDDILVNFSRKSGNILKWYELMQKMKETTLEYLGSPKVEIQA